MFCYILFIFCYILLRDRKGFAVSVELQDILQRYLALHQRMSSPSLKYLQNQYVEKWEIPMSRQCEEEIIKARWKKIYIGAKICTPCMVNCT